MLFKATKFLVVWSRSNRKPINQRIFFKEIHQLIVKLTWKCKNLHYPQIFLEEQNWRNDITWFLDLL